jgi:hypothetical protein
MGLLRVLFGLRKKDGTKEKKFGMYNTDDDTIKTSDGKKYNAGRVAQVEKVWPGKQNCE